MQASRKISPNSLNKNLINVKLDSRIPGEPGLDGNFHSGQRQGHVSYNPNDVYDPMFPNDYERLSREHAQRIRHSPTKVELKIQKTTETVKLSAEEAYERRLRLLEEEERRQKTGTPSPASDTGKDVGLKILQKLGWKEGKGLGANEQGIMTPLVAKNLTKNVGVIVHDTVLVGARKGGVTAPAADKSRETSYDNADASALNHTATRILKVTCSDCSETAESLQEEFEDKMCHYGSLVNLSVIPSSEAGTFMVYCEFEEVEQAQNAMTNINKATMRFNTSSTFVSEEEYSSI